MKAPSSETSTSAIPHNPGKVLRHARESQGLTLSGVSVQLNLPERLLAFVEAGDFSQLPGHTFARGYVRSYAKLLGLDQAQLVQDFDRFTGTNAKGSAVRNLGRIEEPSRFSSMGLRLLTLVLLLGLAGVVFFWWQDAHMTDRVNRLVSSPEHVEVEGADGSIQIHPLDDAEPTPLPAPASGPNVASVLPLPLGTKSQTPPTGSASVSSVGTGQDKAAALDLAPSRSEQAASVAAEPQPLPAGQGRLELHFTANCWTRVIDGDGRVLVNTLMKSGTTHSVQGKEPLNVRFGYAKAAQLTYNGTAIDLAPHTKGSVARIQLGQ